jgi:cytochrome P450
MVAMLSVMTDDFIVLNSAHILIISIAVFIGWYVFAHKTVDESSFPPEVPNMTFLQFIVRFLANDSPQFLLTLVRTWKTGVFRIPGTKYPPIIIVADPALAREVLEDPLNVKASKMLKFFDLAASGETFFAANGHRANHVRKSTTAAFSNQNIQRMSRIINDILKDWIDNRLEPLYVQTNTPIDMDNEMILMTTDIISQVAFDYQMAPADRLLFVGKMQSCMEIFFRRGMNPLKKIDAVAWMFPDLRRGHKAALELRALGKRMITACRENPNPEKKDTLIYMIANDPEYASDDERARDVLIYFFAGFDTTAHSIAWTMLELARNPKEQEKLRAALEEFTSTSTTEEDLRLCPAVKHATRETLRLHTPAALGSARLAKKDVPVPGSKTVIPAGSFCLMPFYVILRNEQIYKHPDAYCPSRWENPSEEMLRTFMPFAIGRRNCQGQALANTEMNTVVARLCSKYSFEVVDEGKPDCLVTLKPSGSTLRFHRL